MPLDPHMIVDPPPCENISSLKLYQVMMYRYGHKQGHSYLLGIFTNEEEARSRASEEKTKRSSKYSPEIVEAIPNSLKDSKVVLPLENVYTSRTNAICNCCGQVIKKGE